MVEAGKCAVAKRGQFYLKPRMATTLLHSAMYYQTKLSRFMVLSRHVSVSRPDHKYCQQFIKLNFERQPAMPDCSALMRFTRLYNKLQESNFGNVGP
jgi:hypothetical protein